MKSLNRRLIVSAVVVLVCFVLVTAWVLQRANQERQLEAAYFRLQGAVYGVLGATDFDMEGNLAVDQFSLPDPRLNQLASGLYAEIRDASGAILWRSISSVEQPALAPPGGVGEWQLRYDDEFLYASLGVRWFIEDVSHRITVHVYTLASELLEAQDAYTRSLLTWLGLLSLALLLGLYAVLRWAIAPLHALGEAVDDVRSGQRERLDVETPLELDGIRQAINRLLAHEQQRRKRYQETMEDLAHSLKTPLAVLRNDAHEKSNAEQSGQVERIDQILSYYLSRAASGHAPFAPAIRLRPYIERTVDSLARVYRDKAVTTDIECAAELEVGLEEKLLFELLGNTLDNAFKWASRTIRIVCQAEERFIRITITDDGPGFSAADPSICLQRGVRADQREPGEGIGLAAVDQLLREAGGDIRLGNADSGGAVVTLFLPTH